MKSIDLGYLEEPTIKFGHDQDMADPRDGLILFGPYETSPYREAQVGVIGTIEGIRAYSEFTNIISHPIESNNFARPSFPGIEAVYSIKWPSAPAYQSIIEHSVIEKCINQRNVNKRTYDIVSLYLDRIMKITHTEEINIHLWYVIVPQVVWHECRPRSKTSGKIITNAEINDISNAQAQLFDELEEDIGRRLEISQSDPDFHDQLKARAIEAGILTPIQIIVEPTLSFQTKERLEPYTSDMRAHVAWTHTNSLFYKLGKLPWRLSQVRDGVCYLGMVFKKLGDKSRPRFACSAAQLFLDSGDGTVFRGNNGPWLNSETLEFHLDRENSKQLLDRAIRAYIEKHRSPPNELFVHGRVRFSREEWAGFQEAANNYNPAIKVVGVSIRETGMIKLYRDLENRNTRYGVMRGTYYIANEKEAYLWTKGFIPRFQTSSTLETPNPIYIRITHGNANIQTVLADILALTKVNYNACIFGDGIPVTLRFSNSVGDILTAIPRLTNPPQPFKFYI